MIKIPIQDIYAGGEASPLFVDIDGDGDLDLYVGDRNGNIWYFENQAAVSTGVSELENNLAKIYSHASVIYINIAKAEKSTITVFDLSGRKIKELQTSEKEVQINSLQEGTYIVRVNSDKGTQVEKVFVK